MGCQGRPRLVPEGEGVPPLQGDTGGAGHQPDPWLREGIGEDCVIVLPLFLHLWTEFPMKRGIIGLPCDSAVYYFVESFISPTVSKVTQL